MSIVNMLDEGEYLPKDPKCTLCGEKQHRDLLWYRGSFRENVGYDIVLCPKCCWNTGEGFILDILQLQTIYKMRLISGQWGLTLERKFPSHKGKGVERFNEFKKKIMSEE